MSENDERQDATRDVTDPAEQECAIFQASMAYRIGAGEDLHQNPHMLTCARCRAFYSDLQGIVNAFIEAFPPEVEPRDELWAKISSQMEPEGSRTTEETENSGEDTPVPSDLALEGGVA